MADEQDELFGGITLRERYLFGCKVKAVLAFFQTPRQRGKALLEMLTMRDEIVEKIYKNTIQQNRHGN